MKIDEMKNSIVELLHVSFDTDKKEDVQISEAVLEENSLNERTFWEKVCPLLQREGVLKSFDDPDYILSDFNRNLLTTAEYKAESKNMDWLMNHHTDTPNYSVQLDILKARLVEINAKYRKIYWHKFVVNKAKLLKLKRLTGSSMKVIVNIDQDNGISRIIEGRAVRYPHVKSSSKIFLTISFLMQNEQATLKELSTHNGQLQKSVKRSIADFNKKSRSRLKLPANPIIGDGIYELNRKFIEFI